MSIETEINRISANVSGTLSAISEMGGEVPDGATSDDMAAGVRSIPVGAKIDDTTPSSTTTYSSQKIESKLTALNDANAALIEVSRTEPTAENTELWIHPNADEVQLPQINDSVESAQDTWSSKKIAAEVSNKANEKDLAVVAKSGSYNDLTGKPTIPTVPSTLPNPNALTFTGAVNETYDGSAAKSVAIPTVPSALPNPNKLTFTGAVTAEYDGSAPVNVEIPEGGGGSYTLPIANATTLGGVKPEAKTDVMNQPVGVDANGRLYAPAAALPTNEQVSTAVDAYLTANGVKCNDVWVDLGTVTVAAGEEPKILGWNLAGTIKKFCIYGSTPAHGGSGNKQILPRGGMKTNTSGPFFTNVGNWGDNASLTYYYSVYAEKIKNGLRDSFAWWGVGGCSQFSGLGSTFLSPADGFSMNPSSGLYIATHWIDTVFPVGATFRAWVVYE